MVRICAKYPKYGPKATTGVTYVHYVPVWVPWFIGFAFFWAFFGLFSTQKWSILNLKIFQITKTRFLSKFEIFSRFLSKIRLNQPQTRRLRVLLG